MERLIRLVIIVVLLLAAIKYGKPWIEQAMQGGGRSGGRASGDTPGTECVEAAQRARDAFGSTMTSLHPGQSLDDGTSSLDDAIGAAHHACTCSSEACLRASEALNLLADAAAQVRNATQVGQAAIGAARRLERVDALLVQAESAAGW